MKQVKAAIFDLDGTIVDTLESIALAGNRMLIECGLEAIEKEKYKYFAGDGADTLVERVLRSAGDKDLAYFEKAKSIYKRLFEENCVYKVIAFEGMKETLEEMKHRNIKIAVLTNKPHERAITVLNATFGENFFDLVIGQKEGFPKKPDPKGAILIAQTFQIKPEDCIYIGDTDVDMQTGNRAGMFTIGVLWGFRTKEELEENKAKAIISAPIQLLDFI